jgi:hypothetical protein
MLMIVASDLIQSDKCQLDKRRIQRLWPCRQGRSLATLQLQSVIKRGYTELKPMTTNRHSANHHCNKKNVSVSYLIQSDRFQQGREHTYPK